MKVILIKDVKGVGRAQEHVETKDGYALNFLIPQKLAIPATPSTVKEHASRMKTAADRRALDEQLVAEAIRVLAEVRLTISLRANEQGHLYEQVDARLIKERLESETHLAIPEEAIRLEKPIKEVGSFRIPVAHGEQFGEFALEVVAA